MIALAWPLLRMVGLRVAAWGVAGFVSPFWRWVILGAAILAGFVWWSDYQHDLGRDRATAGAETAVAEAKVEAVTEAAATVAEHAVIEAADAAELAGKSEAEKKVRDENSGDGVLWRADDGWLLAKRQAGGGGR